MRVELLAPGSAGIGEEDIDAVGGLAHLSHQPLELVDAGVIRRDGDGLRAGSLTREGVQGGDGFVAGGGFAAGDVDFGAACLEEAVKLLVCILS